MPLADELYKSLIDESKLYREKVSAIWLQKFTMLGAIIAFAATQAGATGRNSDLIAAALLSLPFIAILLDVKLSEFGIHARVIDDFIIRNYAEPRVLGDWERTKWGESDSSDKVLVMYRSIATVAVAVVPTCVIAVLSVLATKPFLPVAFPYLYVAVVCFCLVYTLVGLILGPTVLFRRIVSMTSKKRSERSVDS